MMNGGLEDDSSLSDAFDPLEASWASLAGWNKSHSGRIVGGAELERALTVEEEAETVEEAAGDFIIPELPEGTELELRLLSTWGDPYYVGLAGLELFGEDGERLGVARVEEVKESLGQGSVPPFVRPENLVGRGGFESRDDTKLWWAPYRLHTPLLLRLTLQGPRKLALLRVWNYNRSRVHASRGVRSLHALLDQRPIFQGEISKAGLADYGDTILFTSDEAVLQRVLANDATVADEARLDRPQTPCANTAPPRPATGDADSFTLSRNRALQQMGRRGRRESGPKEEAKEDKDDGPEWERVEGVAGQGVWTGREVEMEVSGTWGSREGLGLGALRLLGPDGERLRPALLGATASSGPSGGQFWRALEGPCLSEEAEDQWLVSPWDGASVRLRLSFPTPQTFSGLALWNYNTDVEGTFYGARHVQVWVDGREAVGRTELRKAPGSLHFDYVQEVRFLPPDGGPEAAPLRPLSAEEGVRAFTVQLQLHSTWGDEFYIGLNGLRLFDARGEAVELEMKNLAAFPESVNVLEAVDGDPRSSDKLIDDEPDTADPAHMWLAPLLPNQLNRVYLVFDAPRRLSALEVFNYRKTPERGARDVLVLLDDIIVFDGQLPASSAEQTGRLWVNFEPQPSPPPSPDHAASA